VHHAQAHKQEADEDPLTNQIIDGAKSCTSSGSSMTVYTQTPLPVLVLCVQLTAEKAKRQENFGAEIDFVAANVIMAIIADFML